LISRLCASFPTAGDAEATMRAYLEDTRDIPLPWLREGARAFRDQTGRAWLPSLAELRESCARAVVRARRQASGQPKGAVAPQYELDVAATLDWARRHAPLGFAQVAAIEARAGHQRRIAAANAEAAAEANRGPRGQSAGEALAQVISGLRVVDDQGMPVPAPQLAQDISIEGRHVPGWQQSSKALAVRGRSLATLLAYRLLGLHIPTQGLTRADWERCDATMRAHRDLAGEEACAWWFSDLREVCWQAAQRNDQEASR